ncbi:hypothetical protein Btru_065999 [Bulinus truncatus]|nr:hypothetical protein Btru_065999 [Bulinus truncatus]
MFLQMYVMRLFIWHLTLQAVVTMAPPMFLQMYVTRLVIWHLTLQAVVTVAPFYDPQHLQEETEIFPPDHTDKKNSISDDLLTSNTGFISTTISSMLPQMPRRSPDKVTDLVYDDIYVGATDGAADDGYGENNAHIYDGSDPGGFLDNVEHNKYGAHDSTAFPLQHDDSDIHWMGGRGELNYSFSKSHLQDTKSINKGIAIHSKVQNYDNTSLELHNVTRTLVETMTSDVDGTANRQQIILPVFNSTQTSRNWFLKTKTFITRSQSSMNISVTTATVRGLIELFHEKSKSASSEGHSSEGRSKTYDEISLTSSGPGESDIRPIRFNLTSLLDTLMMAYDRRLRPGFGGKK